MNVRGHWEVFDSYTDAEDYKDYLECKMNRHGEYIYSQEEIDAMEIVPYNKQTVDGTDDSWSRVFGIR